MKRGREGRKMRLLTPKERKIIYDAIYVHIQDDDRPPEEVIKQDFGGNEDAYLWTMAKWHGVPVDEEQKVHV